MPLFGAPRDGLSNATTGARWELYMGLPSTRQAFVSPVRRFIDQRHYRLPPKITPPQCQPPKSGVDAPTPRTRLGSRPRRLGPSPLRQAMYDISPKPRPSSHMPPPSPSQPTSATDVTANTPHSSRHSSRTATRSRSSPSPSTTPGSSATCSGDACCPSRRRRSSRSRSPTAGRCCSRP